MYSNSNKEIEYVVFRKTFQVAISSLTCYFSIRVSCILIPEPRILPCQTQKKPKRFRLRRDRHDCSTKGHAPLAVRDRGTRNQGPP